MSEHVLTDPDEIVAALSSPLLAPPARAGDGPTLALRARMARFAAADVHGDRRALVDAAIATIDVAALCREACRSTQQRLVGTTVDAVALARWVPVAALATALGLVDAADDVPQVGAAPAEVDHDLEVIVADVEAIVAVIGRGGEPTVHSDVAAERLLERARVLGAVAGLDPVAVVSLLYQSLDATAALIAATLHAASTGRRRCAVVPRTVRAARRTGSVAWRTVMPGDRLMLELGPAGLEFGAGPHACPGRHLAEAIADAVVGAVTAAGYQADPATAELDDDGRPLTLLLHPSVTTGVRPLP